MVLSRRDSTIVARHEVPGIMRKIARPSGTIEPILSDPNFSTGVPGVSEAAGAFDALSLAHARGSVSTTNICGTDNDFDRPSGTGASLQRDPGTSCLATISLSLRDKISL